MFSFLKTSGIYSEVLRGEQEKRELRKGQKDPNSISFLLED